MVRDLTNKNADYFESILQLRDVSPEVVKFVEEEISRLGLQIAKIIELKNGFDYYLSDNDLTIDLGRKLQEKFGGDLKTSATLHSRKKDQDLYRITVLFRGLSFKKGDKIIYQGEEYEVKMLGKDILLQEVKTGKKVHLRYREMEKAKKRE